MRRPRVKSPFTWKGMLVGAVFSFFIGVGAPYGEIMLQGSYMALNSSSPAAIFSFFLITLFLNVLLAVIRRQFALTKADLVLVYVMLLMAVTVPTQSFVSYLIPVIGGLLYYASPENNWGELFVPYVERWLAPLDYKLVKDLHEGLPPGESIPWHGWVEILGAWYVFFIVLSFMMICMATILHRQWSANERLAYPMVQLPMRMIEEGEGSLGVPGPFFRGKAMWMGFALPFVLFSLTGLNHYFPFVPAVPFFIDTVWWFRHSVWEIFCLSYAWVGFFYLVNLDITFSIWFFHLFTKVEEGIFNLVGFSSTEQLSLYSFSQTADLTHQSVGACLVFVGFTLWMARGHLKDVWRKAWRADPGVDDSGELIPYRVAVIGFLVSLGLVGAWLWASGIPALILPIFLGVSLVFYILVTRAVTTAGVATARAPEVAAFFVISGWGTSLIGAKGLVALTFTYVWQSEMRLFPLIGCANGLKLAEIIPGPKRRLFWAMWVALLCSLAGATWIVLTICYRDGGINLHPFFMTHQAVRTFTDMARPLLNPTPPDLRGWVFTAIGGAVDGLLLLGQHRFYWWPLHPLGFVISVGWLTSQMWFSCFVSWLLKLLILKYGGIRLYGSAKPFFLGMILGEATAGGVWLFIDWLNGETGNMITAM